MVGKAGFEPATFRSRTNRTLYQAEPRPDTLHAYRFNLSALGSSVPNRGTIQRIANKEAYLDVQHVFSMPLRPPHRQLMSTDNSHPMEMTAVGRPLE
jgi:hypothetical protein